MGFGWDPSMSTRSCDVCGQCVEGWISICDDCVEKGAILFNKFDMFKTQFERLIQKGNEIVESLKQIEVHQEADQMKFYLLNRMQNFVDGNEIFTFDSVDKKLKDIFGEDICQDDELEDD